MEDEAKCCLKRWFGSDTFRFGQESAVLALLAKRDCLVVLATGHGKSLIYQLPPVLGADRSSSSGGAPEADVAVVVSPLISLMEDQVSQLHSRGIPAVYIAHTLGVAAERKALDGVSSGAFRLVYVTPERLSAPTWAETCSRLFAAKRIALFAVDEAHAISEWGADFRPDYKRLSRLRDMCPGVPIVALTATATMAVQCDIVEQLRLVNPLRVIGSFDRPNLVYSACEKTSGGMAADLAFLATPPVDSAIVYVPSIQATEDATFVLRALGATCAPYNSTLSPAQRTETHKRFLSGEIRIVIATVAFGMGIDKPDVRNVVHYGPPRSLEAYFQQSGRAGRDSQPARCTVFWEPVDFGKAEFVTNMSASAEERARSRVLLGHVRDYVADTVTCRRSLLLEYFGEKLEIPHPPDNCCDNCRMRLRETHDFAIEARQLLSAIKRTGRQHRVNKAVETLGSTVGIKRHSKGFWEELALRLKRAGMLEEQRAVDYTVTVLTPSGEAVLVSGKTPVVLPLTQKLAAELVGVPRLPSHSHSAAATTISALHAVPICSATNIADTLADIMPNEPPLRCGRALPPSLLSVGIAAAASTSSSRNRFVVTPQLVCDSLPSIVKQPPSPAVIVVHQNLSPPPSKRVCTQLLTTNTNAVEALALIQQSRNESGSSRRQQQGDSWFMALK